MRPQRLIAIVGLVISGCTTAALERHSLNQTLSITQMRYQQVLNSLAVVADNPGAIPTFALTASGTANVTNSISLESTTIWAHLVSGFSSQAVSASGSHNPELQWTLDPVVAEPQLEALRAAYRWAIFGPPSEGSRELDLLRAVQEEELRGLPDATTAGYHFGVERQLRSLPDGWLHVTDRKSVPRNARYRAHFGSTWVWVGPEDLEGLSEFTLVVMDIATVDLDSLIIRHPMATVKIPRSSEPGKDDTKSTDEAPDRNIQVTEEWYAFQRIAGGDIDVSRPADLKSLPTEFPDVKYPGQSTTQGASFPHQLMRSW